MLDELRGYQKEGDCRVLRRDAADVLAHFTDEEGCV
jgi:hypothetical protein